MPWHEPGLDPGGRLRLQLELARVAGEALRTNEVDIVMLNQAPSLLRHRAIRDGKLLVERDPIARVRFDARALLDYLDTKLLRAEMSRDCERASGKAVLVDPEGIDFSLPARRGVKTMVYNHQLCLLDRELWPFAVRSISEWKNEYYPECAKCAVLDRCGGFFFSAKYRHSNHIKAIEADGTSPRRRILALG